METIGKPWTLNPISHKPIEALNLQLCALSPKTLNPKDPRP